MKRKLSLVLILLLLFNVVGLSPTTLSFAAANLAIEKSVDQSEINVGESFTYTLKYRNASTTDGATNVEIIDVLPEGVEYVSHGESSHVTSSSEVDGTVTFKMTTLAAGSTGFVKIKAKFKEGVTHEGTIALNTASIQATGIDPIVSNEVSVTAKILEPDWSVEKTKTIPSGPIDPTVDSDVTYNIKLSGNSVIGGINMENVVLVDELPEGAIVIDDGGGTYDAGNHEITWDIGTLSVGSVINKTVVLNYPSGTFNTSSDVENTASASGNRIDEAGTLEIEDTVSHSFDDPTAGIGILTKRGRLDEVADDEYSKTQIAEFYISGVENSGNTDLENFTVIDTIPVEIDLTKVETGKFNQDQAVTVSYKTNENDYREWNSSLELRTATNTTLTLDTLETALGGSEYITFVKWEFGTVAPGFADTSSLQVWGEILETDNLGDAVDIGDVFTNTVDLTSTTDALTASASANVTVMDPKPWLVPSKTISNGSSFFANNDIEYKLTLSNHAFATGDLVNPTIIEAFPTAILERYSFTETSISNDSNDDADSINEETLVDGDITYYSFEFENVTLNPGESVTVTFTADFIDDISAGLYENTMYGTTEQDFKAASTIADGTDIDKNASTDTLVSATVPMFNIFTGALESEKWIQGTVTPVWSRYTSADLNYAETTQGGDVNYQIIIKNDDSNGPVGNIIAMDRFPFAGDKGLIDTSSRDSEWKPYLVDTIEALTQAEVAASNPAFIADNPGVGVETPDTMTVYYTTEAQPSLNILKNTEGEISDEWTTEPPVDITTVTHILLDFGDFELPEDKALVVEWPMRAPIGAPAGEKTWNSFAFGATYPDYNGSETVDESFLPTEPIKVGHIIKEDSAINILGDHVWLDSNKNGQQDDGEVGINGVKVNLYTPGGDLLDSTVTGDHYDNGKGYYGFPDLSDGDYIVEFIVPDDLDEALYHLTDANTGDDATDSDATFFDDAGGNHTYRTSVTISGSDDFTVDMGLYQLGSLGNLVWKDLNVNGVYDSDSEAGVDGLTVKLLDASGNPVKKNDASGTATADDYELVTSDGGKYLLKNLNPGEYIVEFSKPADYYWTTEVEGDNRINNDSNADIILGRSDVIELSTGETDLTIDAGFHKGYIGDKVWEDKDVDGIQDSGEPGVNGVTVNLYKSTDLTTPIKTTTSADGGLYYFDDLDDTDGFTYVVTFEKGDDYLYTRSTPGDDDSDSDVGAVVRNIGTVSGIEITDGEKDITIDAGLYKYGTIGNKVWYDTNGNGLQDDGEAGVATVEVELFKGDGTSVGTTVTAIDGTYSFTNLLQGDYYVVFTVPEVLNLDGFTDANIAGDNSVDSDADLITGQSETYSLGYGETYIGLDAGLISYSSLGDYVWEDTNGDGTQDGGEPPVEGVKVSLMRYVDGVGELIKDSEGDVLYKVTDDTGKYLFEDLRPGEYQVIFEDIPVKYVVTDKGDDDSTSDSDANSNGKTDKFVLNGNTVDLSRDMGLYVTTSIGDLVWEDLNVNGIQDADEPGIADVTVQLLDGNGNFLEDTTTDDEGNYLFEDLAVGDYKIKLVEKAGYIVTPQDVGELLEDPADDSDIDVDDLTTVAYTLHSNENIRTVDVGLYRLASLGDKIFYDINGNGIQEEGEEGIEGIVVTLTLPNGDTQVDTTDADGLYEFTDLVPGLYDLELSNLDDYKVTLKGQGTDGEVNSDFDPTTNRIEAYELFSGQTITTLDGGLYLPAQVGNYVWIDKDKDGLQDESESPLENIKVELLDTSGTVLATEVTDENGLYLFDDLIPGDYKIKFYPAGRYKLTQSNVDLDVSDDMDSDADQSTYETVVFTLVATDDVDTFDAGFYYVPRSSSSSSDPEPLPEPEIEDAEIPEGTQTFSLGDYVWFDENSNGIQDSEEVGVSGIKVSLYHSGEVIDTTKTDSEGQYIFEDLEVGTYKVAFESPEGYTFTDKNEGSDVSDSDVISSGMSPSIELDQDDMTIDAGLIKSIVINLEIEDKNTGIPVDEAEIVVTDEAGDVIDTVTVDENGKITVVVPSNEKIKIVVVGEGYQEEEIFMDIFEDDVPLNVDLVNLPPQGVLPNTGSPYYNMFLAGLLMALLGVVGIFKSKA